MIQEVSATSKYAELLENSNKVKSLSSRAMFLKILAVIPVSASRIRTAPVSCIPMARSLESRLNAATEILLPQSMKFFSFADVSTSHCPIVPFEATVKTSLEFK